MTQQKTHGLCNIKTMEKSSLLKELFVTQYFKDYEKSNSVPARSFSQAGPFQLARVNQLLQITYGQSAVFLNCQGKQVEY
jgi:O6-methylguanine-DNA--protein-cysteine methyltransferase